MAKWADDCITAERYDRQRPRIERVKVQLDYEWSLGEPVRPVRIGGLTYLRTDQDQIPSDHLGNLPEF